MEKNQIQKHRLKATGNKLQSQKQLGFLHYVILLSDTNSIKTLYSFDTIKNKTSLNQ